MRHFVIANVKTFFTLYLDYLKMFFSLFQKVKTVNTKTRIMNNEGRFEMKTFGMKF